MGLVTTLREMAWKSVSSSGFGSRKNMVDRTRMLGGPGGYLFCAEVKTCSGPGVPAAVKWSQTNCKGSSTIVPLSAAPASIGYMAKTTCFASSSYATGVQYCVEGTNAGAGWNLPSPSSGGGGGGGGTSSLSSAETGTYAGLGVGVGVMVLLLGASGLLYYIRVYKPRQQPMAAQEQVQTGGGGPVFGTARDVIPADGTGRSDIVTTPPSANLSAAHARASVIPSAPNRLMVDPEAQGGGLVSVQHGKDNEL